MSNVSKGGSWTNSPPQSLTQIVVLFTSAAVGVAVAKGSFTSGSGAFVTRSWPPHGLVVELAAPALAEQLAVELAVVHCCAPALPLDHIGE